MRIPVIVNDCIPQDRFYFVSGDLAEGYADLPGSVMGFLEWPDPDSPATVVEPPPG